MAKSEIEWTDDTDNAAAGCEEARLPDGSMSPECAHCYARLQSARLELMGKDLYTGVAVRNGGGQGNTARWTGVFRWDPDLLVKRFREMKAGHKIFFGSMTDLWHPSHDPALLVALAEEMNRLGDRPEKRLPRAVITLTKHADRLLEWQQKYFPKGLPYWHWPGVTAGVQASANHRIPTLIQVKAAGPRVVSVEPMLGAMDISRWLPRVTGPWIKPPATWAEVQWPEWVPLKIRNELAEFWLEKWGRGPVEYHRSIQRDSNSDIPPFGAEVASNLEIHYRIDERPKPGRYIHAWNNMGRVVHSDGSHSVVYGTSSKTPIPCEPAAGGWQISSIGWVIVGGESGQKARPMHPEWARSLRDQCNRAGVPFHFKQFGEWIPRSHTEMRHDYHAERTPDAGGWRVPVPQKCRWGTIDTDGNFFGETTPWNGHEDDGPGSESIMYNVGKAKAGRLLDGREWNEAPQ